MRQTIRDNHGYFVRARRHLPASTWCAASHCRAATTANAWSPGPCRACRCTRVRMATHGGDIVLIAVGTGIVYEILDGVLY
ncbi:hypothetical protein PBOI14_00540 [Pseudomonas sp. Boi14]|nr:hypothetical protein PBOI14_00540 [Pseudomonas sp. Boi14]